MTDDANNICEHNDLCYMNETALLTLTGTQMVTNSKSADDKLARNMFVMVFRRR